MEQVEVRESVEAAAAGVETAAEVLDPAGIVFVQNAEQKYRIPEEPSVLKSSVQSADMLW